MNLFLESLWLFYVQKMGHLSRTDVSAVFQPYGIILFTCGIDCFHLIFFVSILQFWYFLSILFLEKFYGKLKIYGNRYWEYLAKYLDRFLIALKRSLLQNCSIRYFSSQCVIIRISQDLYFYLLAFPRNNLVKFKF